MKILVTGVAGQLGHDVMNELAARGHEGVGSDLAPAYSGIADGSAVTKAAYVPMDITNAAQVREVISAVHPDAVIHCAAWTAVDAAEDADKQAKVQAINVQGTANIAAVCKELDCKMMYISTDYVFNGQGETPWDPDCKDYQPLNVYGQSKLGGELAVSGALEKSASRGSSVSTAATSSRPCSSSPRRTIRSASSATRSARRPIPTTSPACWWT